jgi:dsDNA-binding SOS-regulon protein
MDASQRWETEALRTGSQFRKTPPQPSAKQQSAETEPHDQDARWVTLKEAEAATGVPVNTLRKWSRKSAIPSYLESDGELSLRMVDLDAVITHAHDLGRETAPPAGQEEVQEEQDDQDDEEEAVTAPDGTLIVPLDAWNKMLNQLGNLHEAGQQLAEARERAAKAETEATFLRERLAEVRAQNTGNEESSQFTVHSSQLEDEGHQPPAVSLQPDEESAQGNDAQPTTSYWRYLTFGWRHRKRRGSKES